MNPFVFSVTCSGYQIAFKWSVNFQLQFLICIQIPWRVSDHETGLSGWKCSFFPISNTYIKLYFNVSSTLLRKNRNTDLLYINIYIYTVPQVCQYLSVCRLEVSTHTGLNSALIVGCLRAFLAALIKVFRKASLSLMKEQFSGLAKSAASNIFWYFVSFQTSHRWKTDPGFETERLDIASFVVGSNKSLASQSRF